MTEPTQTAAARAAGAAGGHLLRPPQHPDAAGAPARLGTTAARVRAGGAAPCRQHLDRPGSPARRRRRLRPHRAPGRGDRSGHRRVPGGHGRRPAGDRRPGLRGLPARHRTDRQPAARAGVANVRLRPVRRGRRPERTCSVRTACRRSGPSSPIPGPRPGTTSGGSSTGRSPTWWPAGCGRAGCGGWPRTGLTTRSRCARCSTPQPAAGERGRPPRRLGGAVRRPPADPVRAARDRGRAAPSTTCATGADERPADRPRRRDRRGPRSGAVAPRRPLRRNRLLRLGEPAGPPHGAGRARALAGSRALPARATPAGVRRAHRRRRARPRARSCTSTCPPRPCPIRSSCSVGCAGPCRPTSRSPRSTRAPAGFDARFGAIWRRYCYRISDAITVPDPLRRRDTTTISRPLDVERAQRRRTDPARAAGLRRLLQASGRRDDGTDPARARGRPRPGGDGSRSPCGRTPSATRWCVAWSAPWSRSARGRRTVDWLTSLTAAAVRNSEVPVLPAHGLTLEEVGYPPDDQLAERAAASRSRAPCRTARAEAVDDPSPIDGGDSRDRALLQRHPDRPGAAPGGHRRPVRPHRHGPDRQRRLRRGRARPGHRRAAAARSRLRPGSPRILDLGCGWGRDRAGPGPGLPRRRDRRRRRQRPGVGTLPRQRGPAAGGLDGSGPTVPIRCPPTPGTTSSGPTPRSGSARRRCTSCCSPGCRG